MTKLIGYLRPYVWWIIAIFALLFGQAMADLSLPAYMSDIVNVGIQQNGIQTAVPQAVRPSEFSRLTLFMSEAEKAEVSASYALLDKTALSPDVYNSQVKKYPLLATSPLYVLDDVGKSQIERLNQIFTRAIPAVAGIEQNGPAALSGSGLQIPVGTDPFAVIAQLPPAQLAGIQKWSWTRQHASANVLKGYSIAYHRRIQSIGVDLGAQDQFHGASD
jgi:ATP-binding cassette subfamily B protein